MHPVHLSFSLAARFTFCLPACTLRSSLSSCPFLCSSCTLQPCLFPLVCLHPVSLSRATLAHPLFLSAATSENGFSTWPGIVFEKFCSHATGRANTRGSSCAQVCNSVYAAGYTHTGPLLTGITMIDTRVSFFLRVIAPPPQPTPRAGCWISSGPFATGWQPARIHGTTTNQDTRVRHVASPWAAPFQNEFFFPLYVSFSVPLCTCNLCICAWMDV